MPLSRHYKGHGEEVMENMQKTYDPETAKRVFYARENKLKKSHAKKRHAKKRGGK